jgi:hypothetical protein
MAADWAVADGASSRLACERFSSSYGCRYVRRKSAPPSERSIHSAATAAPHPGPRHEGAGRVSQEVEVEAQAPPRRRRSAARAEGRIGHTRRLKHLPACTGRHVRGYPATPSATPPSAIVPPQLHDRRRARRAMAPANVRPPGCGVASCIRRTTGDNLEPHYDGDANCFMTSAVVATIRSSPKTKRRFPRR